MARPRIFLILIGTLFTTLGCSEGKTELEFSADFSYEIKDNNLVSFYNESDGEYYSLLWDFGVGEPLLSTDKKATYDIYYPLAGEYEVILQVNNYTGTSKTAAKSLSIDKDALDVSFSAQIDPDRPNYVTLLNTSLGDYDSFTWIYRDKEVMNETEHVAYFPFAGKYQIQLRVNKDDQTVSASQDILISEDDPDYEGTYKLVWSDEFDGSEVDLDHWSYETGASGWGNNELQNYTAGENAEVSDGKLIITARKIDDLKKPGSYTSTRLKSAGKEEFTYGRMEIRAKLPSGTGIWPATWMLGSSFSSVGWPACGEIDIMEYVGYQPNTIHSTVHTSSGSGNTGDGNSKTLETCEEEFHVYGLLWTEEKLVFYTDSPDNVTHVYNPVNKTEENWPFDQVQYFILNVAVGGNWGGAQGIDNSIFPQSMEIDYVRVYQEVY
jgi:beta-glucanase (GH16 family)